MIAFLNYFTKVTGWPIYKILTGNRVHYEDKTIQTQKIKGPAILVSNHTSVFDYAIYLFVFFGRTCRFQMAEVLFEKNKLLGFYLRRMGGVRVNRDTTDYSFMQKSAEILEKGGIVGIFPEGRIPEKGAPRPLPFKSGASFLALQTGVPIIPIFTDGKYFVKENSNIVIGKPIYPDEVDKMDISDKEKLEYLDNLLRDKVIQLGGMYEH